MHKSRLAGFMIDCRTDDLDAATGFWSAALGLAVRSGANQDPRYRILDTAPDEPHLEVQQVTHDGSAHRTALLRGTATAPRLRSESQHLEGLS